MAEEQVQTESNHSKAGVLQSLLYLLTSQPELLIEHGQNYAQLIQTELCSQLAAWKRTAWLVVTMLCCLSITGVLAGVAVLLTVSSPPAQIHAPWAMGLVPLCPLLLAAGCWYAMRKQKTSGGYRSVLEQYQQDLAVLEGAAPAS